MGRTPQERAQLIDNVAMCPPGIRAVIVKGWCDGPEPEDVGHCVYPVVAIRTFVRRDYFAPRDDNHVRRRGATHDEMLGLGWRSQGEPDFVTEAVFADEDYGLIGCADDLVAEFMEHGPTARVVPCPWPFERDADCLADVIRSVEETASVYYRARNPGKREGGQESESLE